MVPLRPANPVNQFHLQNYGMTWRDKLHKELSRRVGRSIRELERLSLVLDAPALWLNLHRQGKVSLAVLERICALAPADQDELMADFGEGVPVDDLIRDYGLRVERPERRARNTLDGLIRNLRDVVDRIGLRRTETAKVAGISIEDLKESIRERADQNKHRKPTRTQAESGDWGNEPLTPDELERLYPSDPAKQSFSWPSRNPDEGDEALVPA